MSTEYTVNPIIKDDETAKALLPNITTDADARYQMNVRMADIAESNPELAAAIHDLMWDTEDIFDANQEVKNEQ